jgi:nucleotide-binding universal stress UspA family protein
MGTILCPTRGGEASHPNQDRAISLAKQRGERLIFLYVSDVRFLFKGSGALLGSLETELDEMGEFLLLMAQERAEKQGVQAEREVRRGSFREAIADVIDDHQVTTVVFGTPGQEHRVTTEDYLEALADDLTEELGVEVMMTKDGELVRHSGSSAAG